ncbi:MAG: PAS domain S-box protein [Planctomycetes bacterium]|nr:PAS domain S-box protein [Planctomycetota bacterium]
MNPSGHESLLRALLDACLDAVLLFRPPDGRILDAGRVALGLAALTREELSRRTVLDLVSADGPEGRTALERALSSAAAFESPEGFYLAGRDGERIPIHLSIRMAEWAAKSPGVPPVEPGADSAVEGVPRSVGVLVARDLSPRRKAEQALRLALLKEEAMGRIRDRIISIRNRSDVLELREQWLAELRGLGIPVCRASIQLPVPQPGYFRSGGWFLEDESTYRDPIAAHPWVEEAWRTGKPVLVNRERLAREWPELEPEFQCVLEVPLPGGGSLGVNSLVPGAFDEAGIRTVQDFAGLISEGLRRAQDIEAVREQQRHLSNVLDSMAESVVVLSAQGRILTVNPATCAIWGYEEKELVGEPAQKLFGKELGILEGPGLEDLLRRGSVRNIETMFRSRDSRPIEALFSASVIPGEQGRPQGIVCVSYDASQRKRLEEQLRQSQKMEAIGRLAGGVAHDFNNLLTVIHGYCDLLLSELHDFDPARKPIEEIQKVGERAAVLTRHLLAFSRRQVVQPQVLDLNQVLAAAEAMLRRVTGEGIELVTRSEPGLWRVVADPGLIEQVVLNLVINSRDALTRGGTVTLSTSNLEVQQAEAHRLGRIEPGCYAVLDVSDTGCGMDAETLSHLFEPFFTTKERGRGTGLGLATVYGIIRQSGGQIAVDSEPGRGSTFRVYLPRATEEAAGPNAAGPDAAGPDTRPTPVKETLLLVEDEEVVRRMTRETLELKDFLVLEAADGEAALRIAREHAGPIHLLLTDVVMPGMNGRELVGRLAALRPGIKVIFVSGYPRDILGPEGSLPPGTEFLQKPVPRRTLLKKIRDLLGRPSLVEPL